MAAWKVLLGEVPAALAQEPAGVFSGVLSDPPYGLEFMGRGWDKVVPGVEVWAELLRVCKPGAHALAFGGTRTFHRLTVNMEDAGWEIRDVLCWLYGSGFPKSKNLGDGYGTALKPAWEPIILARKPLEGTVAQNVLAHGCGALAIDACRVAVEGDRPARDRVNNNLRGHTYSGGLDGSLVGSKANGTTSEGRWPANVVLDEEAGAQLDAQSGPTGAAAPVRGTEPSDQIKHAYNERKRVPGAFHGDTGGASRFFYCAKASRKERGEGNTHPTVKPLALCEYLAKLILPPGNGKLLVPFSGSGSEMLGGVRAGWTEIVGVERELEYVKVAERRLGSFLL